MSAMTTAGPRGLTQRGGGAQTATAAGAGLGRRLAVNLAHGAQEALATLRLWRERARQRRQLAAMDDYLLNDIGLTRVDVEAEFQKPFWRP